MLYNDNKIIGFLLLKLRNYLVDSFLAAATIIDQVIFCGLKFLYLCCGLSSSQVKFILPNAKSTQEGISERPCGHL